MKGWDRQAKRLDRPPPSPEDDEAVRRAIPYLDDDSHVLEVGCAAGATAEALRPYAGRWHGIDISAEMIARARKRAGDGLTFAQGTVHSAALDDGDWNVVLAFNVLHFMDLRRDLERIAALLPSGGLFIAQTPCLGELHPAARAAAPLVASLLGLKGLRRLRFAELRDAVGAHFALVEADGRVPLRSWIVGRKG